jgi:hypothetical protein
MQDENDKLPAPAGDDDQALWNSFDEADKTPPPQPGREDAQNFQEGDDAIPGDETPPEGEPAPDAAAQAAQQGDTPKDDPWATVDPALRQQYEAIRREKEALDHRLRSDAGRVARYQREAEELRRRVQSAPQEPTKPALDPRDALKRMTDEYPELAEMLSPVIADLSGRVDTVLSAEQSRQEQALAQEEARLAEQHPDWQSILNQNGDRFAAWLESEAPVAIYQAAHRNANGIANAQEAAKVVAAFKQHIGIGAQPNAPDAAASTPPAPQADRRQRQLAGAAAPPRSSQNRPTVSGIPAEGDPEAIWKAFDIEEARQRR